MTGKTKILAFLSVTVLAAGLGLGRWYQNNNPTEPQLTMESAISTSPSPPLRSPKKTAAAMGNVGPDDVVDAKEWLEHGPKEPLVPPEIRLDAELAPGSVLTSEPLVPPEIRVDAELAPGSSASPTPLSPPEIRVDSPRQ